MESGHGLLTEFQHLPVLQGKRGIVAFGVNVGRESPVRSVAREDRTVPSTLCGSKKSNARTDVAVRAFILRPPFALPLVVHVEIVAQERHSSAAQRA